MELINYKEISMNIILAVVIRHANRVFYTQHYTVVCSLPSCFMFFLTLSHKRQDFRKNIIEHKTCIAFVYNSA